MKKSKGLLYWSPRILSILAILFISMFALVAFSPMLTIWQQIGGFLIHLIPSYILIVMLIVAWKWELIGGIVFTIVGLGTSPFLFDFNYRHNGSIWISLSIVLMISIPFAIVGILFIIGYYKNKKESAIA